LTQHAAIIIMPDPDQLRLGQIEFVPCARQADRPCWSPPTAGSRTG